MHQENENDVPIKINVNLTSGKFDRFQWSLRERGDWLPVNPGSSNFQTTPIREFTTASLTGPSTVRWPMWSKSMAKKRSTMHLVRVSTTLLLQIYNSTNISKFFRHFVMFERNWGMFEKKSQKLLCLDDWFLLRDSCIDFDSSTFLTSMKFVKKSMFRVGIFSQPLSDPIVSSAPATFIGQIYSAMYRTIHMAVPTLTDTKWVDITNRGFYWNSFKSRKGKNGAYIMKRVAVSPHFPNPWFFELTKRPDDRTDYWLGCSSPPPVQKLSTRFYSWVDWGAPWVRRVAGSAQWDFRANWPA